ncbi:hypothetical protein H1235_08400 [Pseudoxanthomonas sp. NC8]|nr:hypothetical protein H1235_08400 [Pseudoxanthomonas sp. NC8]
MEPFWIANIVGAFACVDHAQSGIEYFDDGAIRFIDKLGLTPMSGGSYPPIFRLAEFLPVIIVSDVVKEALAAHQITGFTFYRPEDFSL